MQKKIVVMNELLKQAEIVSNKYNFMNENAKTESLEISEYFSYVNSSYI